MKLLQEEDLDCNVVTVHSTFFGRVSQAAADFNFVISLNKIIIIDASGEALPSHPSPMALLINIVAAFASKTSGSRSRYAPIS